MNLIEPVILGLVQGVTEFLPISSSAHLRIAGEFLPSATDPGATFTAITQIGTEAAVLVYFRRDIARVIERWFRSFGGNVPKNDPDVRLGWLIIIGTVPIVLVGYFAQHQIRSGVRSLWVIATALIVFGIALGLVDRLAKNIRELGELSYGQGILFGFAQALALIPGVSRSGATTTMGLALGYTRPAAAEYAFLLAVPAVFGSGLLELTTSFRDRSAYSAKGTAVATAVSFGAGLAVIAFLMKYVSKHSFLPFAVYRLLLGCGLLVLLRKGVLRTARTGR
ncbi:MAG TPA: undecaprenyl-diphosphate phosphatase [Terrimicrobiaceae bacterium]